MGRIIVMANQKGGVGKTTTAVNLGAYLADLGKKVLLVDFDPQGNLTSNFGLSGYKAGIYELISEKEVIENCIYETEVENLSVIPANVDLAGASVELISVEERETVLKDAIFPLKNRFDFIFVDCPPTLGILTINGLTAADEVIIPLQCEYFALEGLSQLMSTIEMIKNTTNPNLNLCGIVFTMFDSRTRLSNDVVQNVSENFKDKVFKTIIPRNIRLSEAPSYSIPINIYDSLCLGAKSYEKLAEELINRG